MSDIELKILPEGNYAGDVELDPVGDIAATDVQAAIEELDREKTPLERIERLEIIVAQILKWQEETFDELPAGTEDFLNDFRDSLEE